VIEAVIGSHQPLQIVPLHRISLNVCSSNIPLFKFSATVRSDSLSKPVVVFTHGPGVATHRRTSSPTLASTDARVSIIACLTVVPPEILERRGAAAGPRILIGCVATSAAAIRPPMFKHRAGALD
jgi:hypothetical protein